MQSTGGTKENSEPACRRNRGRGRNIFDGTTYWFNKDTNITPPVCVAAYAGATRPGYRYVHLDHPGHVGLWHLVHGYLVCGMDVQEWLLMAIATVALFFPTLGRAFLPVPLATPLMILGGANLVVFVYLTQKKRVTRHP